VSLINDHKGKPYEDNLCFFRCVALHSGKQLHSLVKPTKSIYREYTQQPIDQFQGVTLEQLPTLEECFKLNIIVYELVEQDLDNDEQDTEAGMDGQRQVVAQLVRRSLDKYTDTMYLNLYGTDRQHHFSYITSIDRYCKNYNCRKCGKIWKTAKQLHRHEVTCEYQGKTYNIIYL